MFSSKPERSGSYTAPCVTEASGYGVSSFKSRAGGYVVEIVEKSSGEVVAGTQPVVFGNLDDVARVVERLRSGRGIPPEFYA